MPLATIHFKRIIQESQEFGSDEDFMVSRIFFDIEIEERAYPECYVDIRQPRGSDFTNDPVEVCTPQGYPGPLSLSVIGEEAETYYRESFGPEGSAFRFGEGAGITMEGNIVYKLKSVQIEISNHSPAW